MVSWGKKLYIKKIMHINIGITPTKSEESKNL